MNDDFSHTSVLKKSERKEVPVGVRSPGARKGDGRKARSNSAYDIPSPSKNGNDNGDGNNDRKPREDAQNDG
ncbi:hypothetical protein HYFRA_00010459 [Hymenoscyphus fraxineus]|uniref:Uncharacterized protein n=1 Tax=Hymenoscyphus fraxineus TaxID=746836 RepID=A0A9N9PWB2_9HELO|nr:hypothetical protein HYFRA_00010459 [Hymenoscyphus fraxineus]